jgi:hypothetical protein
MPKGTFVHPDNIGKQFAPLFHGTSEDFNVGDEITPQGDSPFAFATTNASIAQGVASSRAGSWDKAKIYVVERKDPNELDHDTELAEAQTKQQGEDHWTHPFTQMSRKGFVVKDTNWLHPRHHDPDYKGD